MSLYKSLSSPSSAVSQGRTLGGILFLPSCDIFSVVVAVVGVEAGIRNEAVATSSTVLCVQCIQWQAKSG